jgi:hypothetical protein
MGQRRTPRGPISGIWLVPLVHDEFEADRKPGRLLHRKLTDLRPVSQADVIDDSLPSPYVPTSDRPRCDAFPYEVCTPPFRGRIVLTESQVTRLLDVPFERDTARYNHSGLRLDQSRNDAYERQLCQS